MQKPLSNHSRYDEATAFLSQIDDDWAQLIHQVGPCGFAPKPQREPYQALIRAVAYQQLHGKAGDAILKRFLALYADVFPAPQLLLTTAFDDLRACGFSARKIETLQGIAQGAMSGLVPTREIALKMDDEALVQQLIQLKGIGRWTVEMLLMFTLERMDILPVDDFGVVQGYKRFKGLDVVPNRKAFLNIGEAWQPYRTIASWYLWQVPKLSAESKV